MIVTKYRMKGAFATVGALRTPKDGTIGLDTKKVTAGAIHAGIGAWKGPLEGSDA